VYIPGFLVALDIHLSKSKGRWPQWRAIMAGDVSGQEDHPWLLLHESPTPSSPSTSEGFLKPSASKVAATTMVGPTQAGPSKPALVPVTDPH
jgi:hypothetical protein